MAAKRIERVFYNANELHEITGLSLNTCRKVIQQCNSELKAKGMLTFEGKVRVSYFNKRIGE